MIKARAKLALPGPDLPSKQAWFSSGEAAYLMGVSATFIADACDRADLYHCRTPGGHRRIPRSSLIGYMRRLGVPLDISCQGTPRTKHGVHAPADVPIQLRK